MYVKQVMPDFEDEARVVALPSRLEQLRGSLDVLAKEAAQLELALASNLIGAASEAIAEEMGQRQTG